MKALQLIEEKGSRIAVNPASVEAITNPLLDDIDAPRRLLPQLDEEAPKPDQDNQ